MLLLTNNDEEPSENIDDFVEKKASALKRYCEKHSVSGGFVCYDEGEDELLLNADGYSDDSMNESWHSL